MTWSLGGRCNHHSPWLRRGLVANEGPETLNGRDRAVHELHQARNQERATESWERTQDEEGGAEGGIYSR